MQILGIDVLRKKLADKSIKVKKRYVFYDAHETIKDLGISTPPALRYFMSTLGWCAKGVDSLADRLSFKEFRNDDFELNKIFKANNQDILTDSMILESLIASCSFVFLQPTDNYPKMQVLTADSATGVIDPVTFMLTEGYAVLEWDKTKTFKVREAYFIPGEIHLFENGQEVEVKQTPYKCIPLVPIIFRPSASRPFGHSRISRACMDYTASAIRTIKRSEIGAEFFSYPQKYVTGLSQDAEPMEKWKATMSSLLTFTKDESGDHPILGQFSTQSMTPHLEQLKMFASLFAGEVGLTLYDMGFSTENPQSAEAIKASHDVLRLTADKAKSRYATNLINVGVVAASIRNGKDIDRESFVDTEVVWKPSFAPDINSLGALGDAVLKLQQAFPDYITEEKLKELTGI